MAHGDTLSVVHDLENAGFDRKQAEGVASAVHKAMTEGAATRADLQALENRMEARLWRALLVQGAAVVAAVAALKLIP